MTNTELIQEIRNEIERLKTVQLKRIQEGDLVDAEPYDKNEAYNDLLSFISTLEPEKPVPNDLEEAAWDCVLDSVDVNNPVLLPKYKELLTYLFIAGAKWNRSQMISALKNGGELPIEFYDKLHEVDQAAFQNGKKDMMKQIMQEAVEGTIDDCGTPARLRLEMPGGSFKIGDKVRVIVLPKEN